MQIKYGTQSQYPIEKPLTFVQFLSRNLLLGLTFEGIVRHIGWVNSSPFDRDSNDTLSLKQIDYFQILPGAQAQKVEDVIYVEPLKTCGEESCTEQGLNDASPGSEITNETTRLFSRFSDWATQQYESLQDRVSDLGVTQSVTNYVSDNQDWLVVASSVIATYSFMNWMTANRLKNDYARNILSMTTGIGITCLASYALGKQLNVNLVSDIGIRIIGYHQVVQLVVPAINYSLKACTQFNNFLAKPMAYAGQQPKTKAR